MVKFFYKKQIMLLIISLLSISSYSQKRTYDNIDMIFNFGSSSTNDLSILAAGRIHNNMYLCIDYGQNLRIDKRNALMGIGLGSNKAVILLKIGQNYTNFEIPKKPHSELDYGIEYLWILDSTKKITLCYGLCYTKYTGVQFKLGTAF